MAEISTIVTGIKTRIASVLGSTYSELSHTNEVDKNSFKGATKRYGVEAGDIVQVEEKGVLGKFTVEQAFKIKLTDDYTSSQISDSSKLTTANGLIEKQLSIFADLTSSRCGASSLVIQTTSLSVDEPEYLDDTNVILVTATVAVTYRKTI